MNHSDPKRDAFMLRGALRKKGYDWWWHNFVGVNPLTGEERSFFIEYYVINPALSPEQVVLGQDPAAKKAGKRPCYAMLNVGSWGKNKKQLHQYFALKDCHFSKTKEEVAFGDNTLSETHLQGSVQVNKEEAEDPAHLSDEGSMSWDLTLSKEVAFNVGYGASRFFRSLNAFEMFWHAEGMKSVYSGKIVYDGIPYLVTPETSYGYADKNWGKDYTSPWVWFSSCDIRSNITGKTLTDSVFDLGGGRPKAFGIALKGKILIDFYYEGKDYEYNFSKFWKRSSVDFHCQEEEKQIHWSVRAKNSENSFVLRGLLPQRGHALCQL
jgi:tocopherol cyclase